LDCHLVVDVLSSLLCLFVVEFEQGLAQLLEDLHS
jgi:hypothetical protein